MPSLKDIANSITEGTKDIYDFVGPKDLTDALQGKKFDKVGAVLDTADLAITAGTAGTGKAVTTAVKPVVKNVIKTGIKKADDLVDVVKGFFKGSNVTKEGAEAATKKMDNISGKAPVSRDILKSEGKLDNLGQGIKPYTPEGTLSGKPTLTRSEAKAQIAGLSPENKGILDKIKQQYGPAVKEGKIKLDKLWGAIKKHPKISALTGVLGLGSLLVAFDDDEENDKKAPVGTISEGGEVILNDKKNLPSKSKDNISDKLVIDPKHLTSGMLPYQVVQKTLGVGWNDNRDKIDNILKTNGIDLDKVGPRGSAERNIALSNLVLQISKDKEAFAELKNSLAPKQEDDGLSVD